MNLQIFEEAPADVVTVYEWYESKRNGLGCDFELCLDEVFAGLYEVLKFIRISIEKLDVRY